MKKRRARSLAQYGSDTNRAGEACASFSTARVSHTGRVAEACSSFSAHGSGARGVSKSRVRGFCRTRGMFEGRVHGFSVEHEA